MYTQRDEEQHILKACEGATRKRVLDIGAYHATQLSNSRALIEAGWGGVLIEPSPGPVRGLVQEYGRNVDIDVVCAAVTVQGQMIQLAITDDAVSSSDETCVSKWSAQGGYFGMMLIPSITIPFILDRFGAFDCVSIDTEGSSVDLLHVLLATEMFPRCIVVEHDNRILEVLQEARKRGYHSVYESQENIVLSL